MRQTGFRRDESGKTAALIPSLARPTACHAFCMMLLRWPEITVWRATEKCSCNYMICDTLLLLYHWLPMRLVALPAGDLGKNLSWSFGKSIRVVNQWGKRDFMHLAGCLAENIISKCGAREQLKWEWGFWCKTQYLWEKWKYSLKDLNVINSEASMSPKRCSGTPPAKVCVCVCFQS